MKKWWCKHFKKVIKNCCGEGYPFIGQEKVTIVGFLYTKKWKFCPLCGKERPNE